jgi:hypothetical protein
VSEAKRRQNLIRACIAMIVALGALAVGPFLPYAALGAAVVVSLVFGGSAVVFFVLSRPTRSEVPGYEGRLSPRQQSALLWGGIGALFVIGNVVSLIKHY